METTIFKIHSSCLNLTVYTYAKLQVSSQVNAFLVLTVSAEWNECVSVGMCVCTGEREWVRTLTP